MPYSSGAHSDLFVNAPDLLYGQSRSHVYGCVQGEFDEQDGSLPARETLLKLDDGRVAHVWLQAAPGAPLQQAFDMASGLRFGADRQVAAGQ